MISDADTREEFSAQDRDWERCGSDLNEFKFTGDISPINKGDQKMKCRGAIVLALTSSSTATTLKVPLRSALTTVSVPL